MSTGQTGGRLDFRPLPPRGKSQVNFKQKGEHMSNAIVVSVQAKDFVAAGSGTKAADPAYSNLTVTHGQSGHVEWKVDLPKAGQYRLLALMTAHEARPCALSINGEPQAGPILGEVTGSWHSDTLQWFAYGPYAFKQGENRFRIDFTDYQPHLKEFGFAPELPEPAALAREAGALEAAYQAALADPLNHLCRLDVAVGGEWKGVQVQNQSQANGAALVRHGGPGNRVKFIKSPQVAGGFLIAVEVRNIWKTLNVKGQSADDYAAIIRASGDGNVFKIIGNGQGGYHLSVQAGSNYDDWKGVHVHSQGGDDNAALIRHAGPGNVFQLVASEELAEPDRIDALKDAWLAKQAEYEQSLAESAAAAQEPPSQSEAATGVAVEQEPPGTEPAPAARAGRQVLNAAKLYAESRLLPGGSLLVEGKVVEGGAHTALWLGTRLAGGLVGSVGWMLVAANSYSRSVSGKHLHEHVAEFFNKDR